ncbi:MAG: YIP1 family protein [Chlorobi bacterium]|nr:YIP1 family protein [Chlorobiota bacterium]MCI0715764.1 YIP1 family protein [Chlorobiota bacterium]
MEENTEQSAAAIQSPEPPPENITLGDALAGVFAEPGETFTSVKQSTKKNYWVIPILIVMVVSILSTLLVMGDEELVSEIQTKQKKAMEERLDNAVKEGKMSREQADEQIEQAQKFMSGSMMMIFGLIFSVVGVLVFFFLKGLIYWGGVKIFKGAASYIDVLNVLGLSAIITAIQLVIDSVMAILMGKLLVNIGPVLLVNQDSVGMAMYAFLANFDLINIWYLIVVGIGLAKVSALSSAKTISMVFVLWLIWVVLTSFGPLKFFVGG